MLADAGGLNSARYCWNATNSDIGNGCQFFAKCFWHRWFKSMTLRLRKSTLNDGARVLDIWRRAVDATHDFLTAKDRRDIEIEVAAFLPHATLDLIVNEDDYPLGFMLLDDNHMEALFVDPDFRGTGIGRALVEEGIRHCPNLLTDVNEQNTQAIGFYERLGFIRCGRSDLDGQGRPYPLIHLRYIGKSLTTDLLHAATQR